MSEREVPRVYVVDDHVLVRRGLELLLDSETDLMMCGEAEGVSQALRGIGETNPDVVVIDISLKDGNGIELIKEIRSRFPGVKAIVSSMHNETFYGERALRAGALGYVSKQEPAERLIEAIRHVLQGKVFLSHDIVDRALNTVAPSEDNRASDPLSSLSGREFEVFELLGDGETTRSIASKLHLSAKTVDTHRENIKRKLGLENAAQLRCLAARWKLEREQAEEAQERP